MITGLLLTVINVSDCVCKLLHCFFLHKDCNLGHDGEDKQRAAVSNLLEQARAAEAASMLPAYVLSQVHQLLFPGL